MSFIQKRLASVNGLDAYGLSLTNVGAPVNDTDATNKGFMVTYVTQAIADATSSISGGSFYIGTTQIALNRASGALDLTGITSIDGNAATATKLATARTISLTGDATGSLSFDGSADASAALTLANSGVTAGAGYNFFTVDAKGRVTAAESKAYLLGSEAVTSGAGDAAVSGTVLAPVVTLNVVNDAVNDQFVKVTVNTKGLVTGVSAVGSADIIAALGYTPADNATITGNKITIGTTEINLGATATDLAGLTSVEATTFTGSLNGTAAVATQVSVTEDSTTTYDQPLVFVDLPEGNGNAGAKMAAALTYNVSTGTLKAGAFEGNFTGDVTGAASMLQMTEENDSGSTMAVLFTSQAMGGGGAPVAHAGALFYIPSQQTLYAGKFSGDGSLLTNIAASSVVGGSVTLGTTQVDLGATVTTLAGLTSVTSTSFVGALTGNADTATKLATARSITLTGDATGTASFDGSADASIAVTLPASGVTAATYTKVAVNAKGLVTSGGALLASDIPNLDFSKITTGLPTTAAGYGITDVVTTDKLGVANGVATLNGAGLVPAEQLPSYVDDVLEYATRSAFPATGESGKIYVAADDSTCWRWSGTTYVEIVSSPGTTDNIVEGSVNLFFTAARAQAAVTDITGGAGFAAKVKTADGSVEIVTYTSSGTTAEVIDSMTAVDTRTVKYVIQATAGSNYQTTELLLIHDGVDVYGTQYADVNNGSVLATFSAVINAGQVELSATSTQPNTVFKMVRQALAA